VHFCAEENGMVRYAYNVWSSSNACSGDHSTVSAFGYNGRCSAGKMTTVNGRSLDVFVKVQCVFTATEDEAIIKIN